MTILEERTAVAEEAKTWVNTPFHHRATIKGAGVDCACLISESFNRAIGTHLEVPEYVDQWHLHRNDELYLYHLKEQGFIEIKEEEKQQADLVVSLVGHLYSHGALIVDWPRVIQSESRGRGKVIWVKDLYSNWYFQGRKMKFFSWKGWHLV